ncbi:glycosyltransferase family 2 protein [Listeria costaricensis]|uniref:tetratricopeptide repeat-containing glycosyltransferase family 2 protein n=1 Tax=Listeria costaricensis TaxID=2026604 RepID=UPI000C06D493|nr:glycosyltransferase family 2 protein [Listeria costaricensis]
MRPLVSICMIVKNESHILRQSLASFRKFTDEIIIVDTGSEDDTKAIAREFTEHVYDFTWTGNFSEARNFAAGKASGKWILALDADECLEEASYQKMEAELRSENRADAEIFAVEIISFTGEKGAHTVTSKMARVYKNNQKIAFFGALHEQLDHVDGKTMPLYELGLKVYHYGYMVSVVDKQGKSERNLKILEKEHSNKQGGFHHFNMGQEMRRLGKNKEALQCFTKAFKAREHNQLIWAKLSAYYIAELLGFEKRFDEALQILEEARIIWPDVPEFLLKKADLYDVTHQLEDAKAIYHKLIEPADVTYHPIVLYEATRFLPYKRLGLLYMQEKDYTRSMKYLALAYQENSSDYVVMFQMITLLSKFHRPDEVFDFIIRHQFVKNLDVGIKLLSMIIQQGLTELSRLLFNSLEGLEPLLVEIFQTRIGTMQDFYPVISERAVIAGIKTNLVDAGDLAIWQFENRSLHLDDVMKNSNVGSIYRFIFEQGSQAPRDMYLFVLERAIALGKGAFVDHLLTFRGVYPEQIQAEIADIFFKYDYFDIALDLYNVVDADEVTKQGYINLIGYLTEHEIYDEALAIAERGLENFSDDFRFHRFAIQLDEENRLKRIGEAIDAFPNNRYLAELLDAETTSVY